MTSEYIIRKALKKTITFFTLQAKHQNHYNHVKEIQILRIKIINIYNIGHRYVLRYTRVFIKELCVIHKAY